MRAFSVSGGSCVYKMYSNDVSSEIVAQGYISCYLHNTRQSESKGLMFELHCDNIDASF